VSSTPPPHACCALAAIPRATVLALAALVQVRVTQRRLDAVAGQRRHW
jgi:hypothetical protein